MARSVTCAGTARAEHHGGYSFTGQLSHSLHLADYPSLSQPPLCAIDLRIIDVVLPDGSGIDLAAEIRAMRPQIRVLRGYVETLPKDSVAGRPTPFLPKPYCIDTMFREVHSVLHADVVARD